jgi:hypothetical protein
VSVNFKKVKMASFSCSGSRGAVRKESDGLVLNRVDLTLRPIEKDWEADRIV